MQIYLIVPPKADEQTRQTCLDLCQTGHISALLVQRGEMAEYDYFDWAKTLIAPAQSHNVAVLLDNAPQAVRSLKADGVHLTQSAKDIAEWCKKLKPDSIIGAGEIFSRHDAMTKGEKDIDYVFFGHLAATKAGDNEETAEMANWWAETFEVPAVGFVEQQNLLANQVEFCAVRDQVFDAENPVTTLQTIIDELNKK